MRKIQIILFFLACAIGLLSDAHAQTCTDNENGTRTCEYTASTGAVSPQNAVTAHFVGVYSSDQTTYTEFPSGYSYPSMRISDPTLNMVPNYYVGESVNVNGKTQPIASNDATSVTVTFWGLGPIANGTPFMVNKGGFKSPFGMGGGCYYGGCPAWPFTNFPFSYVLPNGTSASFNNFTGTADFTHQSDVVVRGTASGTDSYGVTVSVVIEFHWSAFCNRGCTKTFRSGTVAITQ
jgi:hypothetical protein